MPHAGAPGPFGTDSLRSGTVSSRRLFAEYLRFCAAVNISKRLEPFTLGARHTRSPTLVGFALPHPLAQRLARAADLLRDRLDRRLLRVMCRLVLQHHPYCSFPDLRGVLVRRTHRSLLSSHRLSGKLGTVQRGGYVDDCARTCGASGTTVPNASGNCAAGDSQRSRRPSPTACWRMARHVAVQQAVRYRCFDSLGLPRLYTPAEAHSERTAVVRDPYARWCGRGGTVRCSPIPIIDLYGLLNSIQE